MARCWTCGVVLPGRGFYYRCQYCKVISELESLRSQASEDLGRLLEVQRQGLDALSEQLSWIASAIEWGFEEVVWQLKQQTDILRSIDHTLKIPSETQANEWRRMAEELRRRGVLDTSEELFRKALDLNPLDYRIYVGLAYTYLQTNRFDDAQIMLEKSLPHAPKRIAREGYEERRKILRLLKTGQKRLAETACYRLIEAIGLNRLLWGFGIENKPVMFVEDENKWLQVLEESDRHLRRRDIHPAEEVVEGREQGIISFTKGVFVNVDTFLRKYEPFDYRSYSYRLLGHIYACREDYEQAASTLKLAIDLSPDYEDAHYDYAQYCALTGKSDECCFALQNAILANPSYFYLAQKEKNFEPLKQDIQNLLEKLNPSHRTEFNLILKEVGPYKINVIRAVRELTSLGLNESKDLVESAPTVVKEGVTRDEAAVGKQKLEEAEATAEITYNEGKLQDSSAESNPRSVAFVCQRCDFQSPKWLGRCPNCQEWNSFIEQPKSK